MASRRLVRALGWAISLALLAAAIAPLPARADGDPASDVLLTQNAFYPYQPPVSASLQQALNAETAAAANAHFPIKVALIAAKLDLGAVRALFGEPQQYADFLGQEISYPAYAGSIAAHSTPQPLLVVMAAGYGVHHMGPAARAAVASLPNPSGSSSDALAQAAVTAIPKLAAASGHPISAASTSGGGSSATWMIVVALMLAAVALTGAVVLTRWRRAAPR